MFLKSLQLFISKIVIYLQKLNLHEVTTEGGNYNEKIGRHAINAINVTIVEHQHSSIDTTESTSNENQNVEHVLKQSETICKARATFILTGTIESIDQTKLEAIAVHLRKLSGDVDLTIIKTEEGSIKLTLEGSPEGLKRLEELFQSRELTEIEGMPIEEVQLLLTKAPEHERKLELNNGSRQTQNVITQDTQSKGTQHKVKILVVDDNTRYLEITTDWLKPQYPEAEILTARTAKEALERIRQLQPDLVIFDLSIPQENLGEEAKIENGIQALREVMQVYPNLNLTVQTSHLKSLRRIKPQIDDHQGGFTLVDKHLSSQEMLARVNWALEGVTHTKNLQAMNRALEFRPEWLQVLKLAYQEGLQDRAIAEHLNVAPRTVLHYWVKIRDILGVYAEDSANLRIQTEIRAREEGLID